MLRRLHVVFTALLLGACAMPPIATLGVPAAGDDVAFPPYGPEVAARFPPPRFSYRTPGLAHNSYTGNDELNALLDELAATPAPGVTARVLDLGSSQRGVALRALHLSRAGTAGRKPAVLLVGQQHGDEPAPAEALLVVANDVARGDLAPLLERIDVVVMPRANPDGGSIGRRLAADGIDLNRDHLLLRAPETRAQAALARDFAPVVVVDAHEYSVLGRWLDKFGGVQRFDVLLQPATIANLHPDVVQAAEQRFRAPLAEALEREGLSSEWYYTTSNDPADKRVSMGGVLPDTGRNVAGLKHAISLLVETRGIGIGRLHLQRRIHTHVTVARFVLQRAAQDADALRALQRDAGAQVAALACRGELTVDAAQTPTRRTLLMLDPDRGDDRPVDVAWQSALELRTLKTRARPCGYWLSADAAEAARRLALLGVEVRRLDAPLQLDAERWRETARSSGPRADVRGTIADADGAVLRVQVELDRAPLAAPAGSYYVPLDQPLAHVAAAALEPDTQSGFFANRIIAALDHAARVMTPPAQRGVPLR